jgi:putative hemolysin
MGITNVLKKTLRETLMPNVKSGSLKSIAFEKIGLPLLVNLSGAEEYEKRCDAFAKRSIANPEDLQYVFKELGINVRIHWNVAPTKQSLFTFNHPTGPTDGIFVQQIVQHFGLQGKVLGDEVMAEVEQIKDAYIPISIRSDNSHKRLAQLRNLKREVRSGQSLILFPAGSVSKMDWVHRIIEEYPWETGFLELAKSNSLDIIPCYIDIGLSNKYYMTKSIYADLSSLILFREGVKLIDSQKGKTIDIYVGDPTSYNNVECNERFAKKFKNECELLKFQSYDNEVVKP